MGNFRNQASGNITAANGAVTLDYRHFDNGGLGVQVTGTWVGTLLIEVSLDGVNFTALAFVDGASGSVVAGSTGITANGYYRTELVGAAKVRVRCSAYTSGTAVVSLVVLTN